MRSHSRKAVPVEKNRKRKKKLQLEMKKEIKLRRTKCRLLRLKITHIVYFTTFIVYITLITSAI